MNLAASIRADLSVEPDLLSSHDRRELQLLDDAPTGAHVVVDIGSRQWVSDDTAQWLHRHVDRLNIEISGTQRANIRAWMDAARTGSAGVVA